MEVTILMPCLNEAETLAVCIKKAQHWLIENKVTGEVLIADNGSTDGSQTIASSLGARVILVKTRGYGAAITEGVFSAKGQYIIMGDSDDSYDFSDLNLFYNKLTDGYDLVMGNRFLGGIKPGAMPFLHRYLGNPVLSCIGKVFFRTPISDFHCGLRGFKKSIVSDLKLQTTGMEFASEMVVKASLFKCKIGEVPTILSREGRTRPPHLRTWRDGWRHLRFLLMYSPKWLFNIPGFILLILGVLLMILTVVKPFEIFNGIYFDTNTLIFSSAFILLGFTCLTLGLFTRTFATEEGFYPKTGFDSKIDNSITLENGLLSGLFFLLLGLSGSFYLLYTWDKSNFGRLDYKYTLRIVVPSITFILLGSQIIFSSFFVSILKIKRN